MILVNNEEIKPVIEVMLTGFGIAFNCFSFFPALVVFFQLSQAFQNTIIEQ